ncbi:uncharacterized protein LOC129778672 isoform X2 [Toxorhynchites rutilus septentrionalis]|uniref:uncharacterized protein LOC129778672 isoform X2 n=1 Tax=Toxorhynchites rutilus septentrionalis TaxID=329112 RepID=UPI00247AD18F|nr:uncharacterized protein LOC129778672 isoform X2 [Toxorhynchites rutilus septentrionalis]
MDNSACRHRFRCLMCSDIALFCDCSENCHHDHPRQLLISDELLLSQYGSKANDPEYTEITIFSCPYCDRQKLSVSSLYDHITLEHLDIPFNVRCPICVCFSRDSASLGSTHLTAHILEKHSLTMEQYHEHIFVYDTYGEDELELLMFIASTLPPTYNEVGRSTTATAVPRDSAHPPTNERTLGRMCPICLELAFEVNCCELQCKHKFHSECITLWKAQNPTCPVCRKRIER